MPNESDSKLEKLRKLDPRARMKRLKELEHKQESLKKRIERLEESTEQEIETEEETQRKMPLPQLASEDETILTTEEKEIKKNS